MAVPKRFYPHLIVFTAVIGIVLFGLITNSGTVGRLIGYAAAIGLELTTLAAAALSGLVVDYRKFWKANAAAGIAVAIIVASTASHERTLLGLRSSMGHQMELMFAAFLATAVLGHAVNAVRLAFVRPKIDPEIVAGIEAGQRAFRQRYGLSVKQTPEELALLYVAEQGSPAKAVSSNKAPAVLAGPEVEFINWEFRPALIIGSSAWFVRNGATTWEKARFEEVMDSGEPVSAAVFLQMFPNLPPFPHAATSRPR